MYVIHVIPFQKASRLDTLTYFSPKNYEIGSIVNVPIRKKIYPALVVKTEPVGDAKATVKSAEYSLLKLPPQKKVFTLPPNLIQTAKELQNIYPASLGAILHQLLPPDVKNGKHPYPSRDSHQHSEDTAPQVLTATLETRYVNYRAHIRSTFAHRGSVLMVVPTSGDVIYAKRMLETGIADRVVTFHSGQTVRDRKTAYEQVEDTSHAKLIIVTPTFAYLERVDLLSIIVEHAGSPLYVNRTRPYLDNKEALKLFAKVGGRSIIFGDIVPRTEDEYLRRKDVYMTVDEEAKRIGFVTPLNIIFRKAEATSDTSFTLFSNTLIKSINSTLEGRGKVFLHAARRGLSPMIICIDCGHIFRCPDSGTPYSLFRTYKNQTEERWFVSSTSGRRIRAADVCPDCGSWRLRERGIGIQQIVDECKELFPRENLFVFDRTTVTTHKRAEALINDFISHRSAIMVGTSMVVPYLQTGVDTCAVVSFDATRAIPSWRADETVFRFLLELRDITKKELLVQTRTEPDLPLLHASRGAVQRFFEDELKLREEVGYPPFKKFILLTWQGSAGANQKTETEIKRILSKIDVSYYQNPYSTDKKAIKHGLIKVEKLEQKLLDDLRQLPPNVKVEINPDRIV